MSHRLLFGGAVACDVPAHFLDSSDIRPIPDAQEVFHDVASGVTVVVEIVEHQPAVADDASALFFFSDLAEQAGIAAQECGVQFVSEVSRHSICDGAPTDPRTRSVAQQALGLQPSLAASSRAYRQPPSRVWVCVFRSPAVGSELLLMVSQPLSASAGEQDGRADSVFQNACRSLRVLDWGLFGADADDRDQREC